MLSLRQSFLNHVAQTSPEPLLLEIEKAQGVYLHDINGKRYLDLISGISVSNLGHCHPNVVAAVQKQCAQFMHLMVYGEMAHYPQVKLSQKLAEVLPESLNNVYLLNSGSEVVEGAMKLAKKYTRRSQIISCKHAYHGSSHGALSILGDEYFKTNYRPLLPDCELIEFNSFKDIEKITDRTAAVFMEPIQAEAGIILPTDGYLEAVRKKCNETGTLLVFDEIQTGFGRTGSLFAFEHSGVIPDILLMAKGMGGGLPIGAFISSKEIMDVFQDNPVLGHITTFGGNPVTCAAALANLETLLADSYIDQVEEKAEMFRVNLKHPAIKAIRGQGLMVALEFESEEVNMKVINACVKNGIVTDWFLFAANCLRIAPPLIIEPEQIKWACDTLLKSIDEALA